MTAEIAIAVAGTVVSLAAAVLGPTMILGKYLGGVLTTQTQHETTLARHDAGIADKGQRIEKLGNEVAELRGELRGAGVLGGGAAGGDFSGRVRP